METKTDYNITLELTFAVITVIIVGVIAKLNLI
jgi:hypothetical protein